MARPTSASSNTNEDEDYYLAPQHQRAFGAGIKRKRVAFVPASNTPDISPSLPPTTSNAGARYLSIVLGAQSQSQSQSQTPPASTASNSTPEPGGEVCAICKRVVTDELRVAHEVSIAHQLCLEHSYPPSHLDRRRKGLKYLEGYGWDPDSRLGLGARRDGIRVPVRAKEKRDTTGLGLFAKDEDEEDRVKKKVVKKQAEGRGVGLLNAKQARKLDDEKKKKAEKLRSAFYSEDLSQYLGPDG